VVVLDDFTKGERIVTKRSVILVVAFSTFLGASGSLLGEKGGRMAGPGLGANHPAAGNSSASTRGASKPAATTSSATNSANTNVSVRLADNAALSSRIQPLLPAGSTLAAASTGFRNQGQFIAALHVSRNLNVPFDQLKAKLTGDHAESLGRAIHDLRPDLSRKTVKRDVRTADRQAERDIDSARLANQLSTNSTLATRARALLPAGANLQNAAGGFEDARQFLLAEHVAHDLNIPFAQLKSKVTGADPVSFEHAVGAFRPDLSSAAIKSELKLGRQQTKADLLAAGGSGADPNEVAQQR
jgi:hypothetical protein